MPAPRKTVFVRDLEHAMEQIAPRRLAQPWDRVGLLAGDRAAPLRRCLLCIDLTPAVLDEAIRARCQAAVAYHPPLFKPIASLVDDRGRAPQDGGALLHRAIRAGVALHSPHTALDAADGGTGDALAALCGAAVIGPLDHAPRPEGDSEVKLTVFVPRADLDRVSRAMFAAGAGRIGLYEQCSFRIPGTGTFFGTQGTDPAVGRKGRLETVDEIRLEMVCPRPRLPDVVAAMRRAHSYEEPAFDVYSLAPKPDSVGIGRLALLKRPATLSRLAALLHRAVAAPALFVGDARRRVQTLAILVGSAGRVHEDFPRALQADVLVTGEIRHHDALALAARGWSAVALGHWASERPVLAPLAARLRKLLPGLDVRTSRADRDPFRVA